MAIVDLKQTLEEKLVRLNLASKVEIERETRHYDEYYYLTESDKFVKVFRQEFLHDPHMALDAIPEVRLVSYHPATSLKELEGVFERGTVPIITRVDGDTSLPGFSPIPNKEGQDTVLVTILVSIPQQKYMKNPYVRVMEKMDLPSVEEIFRHQYSLRYRMVRMMQEECPDACFVYEKDGKIVGVASTRLKKMSFT